MNSHNSHPEDQHPADNDQPQAVPTDSAADSTSGAPGDEASTEPASTESASTEPASTEPSSTGPRTVPPTYPQPEGVPPGYSPPQSGYTEPQPGYTPSGTPNAGPRYPGRPYRTGAQLGFFDWTRSQGIYRGSDRWIGGVASGISHRMGVDPLIVRGIFIVLALFAGIGVLLYGLAWALLPEPDGRIHVQEAGAGRWSAGMTGALITTLLGFPSLGAGFWGWEGNGFGRFLWALLWIGGITYLIYFLVRRSRSRTGNPAMSAPYGASPYAQNASAGNTYAQSYGPNPAYGSNPPYGPSQYGPTPPYGPNPPSGTNPPSGPYGPFDGGLQSPAGPTPPPPAKPLKFGPGTPAVAVTAGTALLAGGGLKALDAGNVIDLGNSANAVVWASAAAVLGLGILISGLRGRTSGLLGFLAVVALIVGGFFNVIQNGDRFRGQPVDWNPVSIEQARDGFQVTGGRGTVDLTNLSITPPLTSDLVIPLDITASNVRVIIPDTVPVQIEADMTMGNLNEGNQNHGGMTTKRSTYNTDKPGSPMILRIDGTMSNVTIQEGN